MALGRTVTAMTGDVTCDMVACDTVQLQTLIC